MSLTDGFLHETHRRQLRATLTRSGLSDGDAALIVDVACHATIEAIAKMDSIVMNAPTDWHQSNALSVACTLIGHRLQIVGDTLREVAAKKGAPFTIARGTMGGVQ